MAAYLEGEDAFKETCLQFCNLVFPQQNTLALLLPLLFGNKEHQLKDVNLQGWPRLLSGILAIMPSDAATPLIKDLAETLRSQNRVIPSQICSILCGEELQPIASDPFFSLLGAHMVEGETETGSVEERESALLAAMGASEIYEYGFTLSNASYRAAPCRQ